MCQGSNLDHYIRSNNFDILPVEPGFVDHLSIKMKLKLHVNNNIYNISYK